MKKICILNLWMGPFPDFYPLWELSAIKNPSVDFFIISDQEGRNDKGNIHFIYMTLQEVKQKTQKLFPFPIKMERAYKLCDYRPVWGLVFSELIEGYDFYGFCDFDIILGNIRNFMTDSFLEGYDKVMEQGNFTLYRNTEEMKHWFRKSTEKDNMAYPYPSVFRCNYACYFDEFLGMSILGWKNPRVYRDQLKGDMVLDFDWHNLNFQSITGRSYLCFWQDGNLYRYFCDSSGVLEPDQEPTPFLLIHLQKRKMKISFNLEEGRERNAFWIVPNQFVLNCPQEALYTKEDCIAYKQEAIHADKVRRWRNVRQNGILNYIPHFFTSRRILKWISQVKKYY